MQAAVTKCHTLGGLNNLNLSLRDPEPEKSNTKIPVESVPGESPLCDSQAAIFFLYPYVTEIE